MHELSRRDWLRATGAAVLGAGSIEIPGVSSRGDTGSAGESPSAWTSAPGKKSSRRLLYNYDAWAPFYKGPSAEQFFENIDMFSGTQVTTVMLSPNAGQSLTYPSKVSEMCHTREMTAEERAVLYQGMTEVVAEATEGIAALWKQKGNDAFGLLVERAIAKGFETFGSFRMNDVHMVQMANGQGPYTDAFYRSHPEWRVPGSWGLNYAVPEVRRHRLAQLEELIRRYPLHGLELDFLRGVPYFPGATQTSGPAPAKATRGRLSFPSGFAEQSVPIMTEFLREVRQMTRRVSREQGRRILLAARIPSSLSGCRRVGLDPVAWHKDGSLDFLTLGHFLHLFYNLPIEEFKTALPGLTIYASVDYILGGPHLEGYLYARDATAEVYRGAAAALFSRGADGIYLFNMFACRANGPDPKGKDWSHDEPVEVLKELGDPATLEGTSKLYLVDSRFDLFDHPLFDTKAQLPQQVTPESPVIVAMTVGEKNPAGKQMTLRVVTAGLPRGAILRVQVNGHRPGGGRKPTQPHLFPEAYDQMPPCPDHCLDFSIEPGYLKCGPNEVVVLSSAPLTVASIELAVSGNSR